MKSKCFFKQASSFLCHHHLLSAVMLAGFLGACGRQTGSPLRKKIAIFTQEDLQRSRPYGTLERAAVSGGQDTGEAVGQLVFRSFKKQYKNRDVKLGIKLGWFGFGTGMHVETGLTQFTTGGLVLSKVPSDDQAAIFTDDKGTLQVRPGEEFTGFCAYEGTYGLTVGSQGEISFAGVRLDQEVGQQKILSLEVVSPLFAIPEGAHLGSLEDLCEKLYEDRYQEILQ